MRRDKRSFFTGLCVGMLAGLVAGLVPIAHSATGKKAWERFGNMFQAGYISGFLDCVRIAKATDRDSYVARSFVLPRGAKPTHFQAWISEAYAKDEKAAERTLPQMIVLAGSKLEAKMGAEIPMNDAGLEGLRSLIDARRAARREAAATEKAVAEPKAADSAAADSQAVAAPAEPAKPGAAADTVKEGVATEPASDD